MNTEDTLRVVKEAIFDGESAEAAESTRQLLNENVDPAQILSEAVVPAMSSIGESMEEGDFFMPEVKMSAKALQGVAEILRMHFVMGEDGDAPPWTGEGDIGDVGVYLRSKVEESRGLPAQELMRIVDMIAKGLDTHEFTPCKIQAKEVDDR